MGRKQKQKPKWQSLVWHKSRSCWRITYKKKTYYPGGRCEFNRDDHDQAMRLWLAQKAELDAMDTWSDDESERIND